MFLGLQGRPTRRIGARKRIVAFIPEYSASLMNRLNLGLGGKVAYEIIKAKKPSVSGIDFGEKVFYKVKHKKKLQKISSRLEYGIVVGVKKSSNELMIACPDGVYFVRSIKRIPIKNRGGGRLY